MYTCVFAIGRPIGHSPLTSNPSEILAQTVVSVGPYAFNIRRPTRHRFTRSEEPASPATTSVLTALHPSSVIAARTDGGIVATLKSLAPSKWSIDSGPSCSREDIISKRAPESSAINHSHTAASNPGEAA